MITPQKKAPRWAEQLRRATDYLVYDFGGGPRPWKFSWVINFQKFGTFFFLGFLMWYYQNFSMAAWVYLALHGIYGLAWFIKDMAFPDSGWQVRITIGGGINAFLAVLGWRQAAFYLWRFIWSFRALVLSGLVPSTRNQNSRHGPGLACCSLRCSEPVCGTPRLSC